MSICSMIRKSVFLFYSLTKAQYKRGTERDQEINAVS